MGMVRTESCGGKRHLRLPRPRGWPACPDADGALTGCQEALRALRAVYSVLRAALWSAWAALHVPGRDASGSGRKGVGVSK